jgi:hypothetical protein
VGLGLTFPMMLLISTVAPDFSEGTGRPLFFATMALLCAAAGWLWGAHLGRLARSPRWRAWGTGAAAGYGLSCPLATYASSEAETYLLNSAQQGVHHPMHLAFALIFAGALLLVVGLTALGVGVASGRGARALPLAAAGAGTAVAAFLAVDLAFDLGGWRVGAPGAEARATMLVVLGAGLVTATSAAGAVLGRALVGPHTASEPLAAGRWRGRRSVAMFEANE